MKKHILFLLCSILCLGGCDDEDSAVNEQARVELSIGEDLYLNDEGDTQTFTVTTNKAWAIKGAEQFDWLVVEPSAGGAGEHTVAIKAVANGTYSPREAELALNCGGETRTFKLIQVQNDALILSAPAFNLTSDIGEFEVVVKSNIDFTVEIPEDSKQWITQDEKTESTRALQSHVLKFKVAEYNETQKERQGTVIIKSSAEDKSQTIVVTQQKLSDELPNLVLKAAGTIEESLAVLTREPDTITTLNVIGRINSLDIEYLNKNFSGKLKDLRMNRTDMVVSEETGKVVFPKSALSKCKELVNFTFPRNIEVIGERIFPTVSKLNCELNIPETVTTIESRAFYNATFKGKLTLPSGLITIGSDAFYGCKLLTGKLEIPVGIKEISGRAFYGCSGLSGELVIPESVEVLGANAFYNCTGFSGELLIPATLKEIGTYAFGNCAGISSIKWVGEPEEIPDYLFYGCKGLAGELRLPAAIKKVGNGVFSSCSQITSIRFPEKLTAIGSTAFSGCIGLVGTLTLPDNLTEIGTNAFQGCTGINEVIFPVSLTSVGGFQKCTALERIELPNTVTKIQENAFLGCSKLKGVTFPQGLKTIGRMAFYSCFVFGGNLDIPGSVETIADYAFKECYELSGVTFHEGLKSIGGNVFQGCSGIKKLELPTSLIEIKEGAFNGIGITELNIPAGIKSLTGFTACMGLKKVTVPATVTEIGAGCFYQCKNLTEIVFEGIITRFGDSAFSSCGFTSFECPESVTELGDYVFAGSPLTWVKFPSNIKNYPANALKGCQFLTHFEIPAYVESLGEGFFSGCSALEEVVLPEKISVLPKQLFYNCKSLKSIVIKGRVTEIGAQCVQGCEMLESFVVPEGVTTLPNNVFWGDDALVDLTLPESLTTINDFVFREMKNLPELTIPKNVTKMGQQLFNGNTAMKKLTVLAEVPPVITTSTFLRVAEDLVIYVPATSLDVYRKANYWSSMTIEAIK